MTKLEIETTTDDELKAVITLLEKMEMKYKIFEDDMLSKEKNIFDVVKEFSKSNMILTLI